jgi:coenzyme F420-reducing hydrogenase gamma subunit
MIVSGEPIKSEMLAMLPGQKLFDQMAGSASTLMDEALSFARSVVGTSPCLGCETCLASTPTQMRFSNSPPTW